MSSLKYLFFSGLGTLLFFVPIFFLFGSSLFFFVLFVVLFLLSLLHSGLFCSILLIKNIYNSRSLVIIYLLLLPLHVLQAGLRPHAASNIHNEVSFSLTDLDLALF